MRDPGRISGGEARIRGRFSYNGNMTGENFSRLRAKFADVLR